MLNGGTGRAARALGPAGMPRFYFHLRNDLSVDDEEGVELPDLAAARDHAIYNARSIAAENAHAGRAQPFTSYRDCRREGDDCRHRAIRGCGKREQLGVGPAAAAPGLQGRLG